MYLLGLDRYFNTIRENTIRDILKLGTLFSRVFKI